MLLGQWVSLVLVTLKNEECKDDVRVSLVLVTLKNEECKDNVRVALVLVPLKNEECKDDVRVLLVLVTLKNEKCKDDVRVWLVLVTLKNEECKDDVRVSHGFFASYVASSDSRFYRFVVLFLACFVFFCYIKGSLSSFFLGGHVFKGV